MHPMLGVPQLHHDQLNVIAKHLQEIKQDTQLQRDTHNDDVVRPFVNKLTRRKLKETPEWFKWNAAEFHQLDQYEQQDTFRPPFTLPPNANILNLLWTYIFKAHENRCKVRCVCNGSPNRRGCVTLADTYASSLE